MQIDFFGCDFFHTLNIFRNELYAIKNFHSHSEVYWQNVGDDVNNTMQAEIKEADEECHESIVDYYVEELINAQSIAPQFHRETILVSLFSQIEFTLLKFCSSFNQEVMYESDNFDKLSKRDVLENIYKYMGGVMGFNLLTFEREWRYLENIKLIRNRLVHSNGKVTRNFREIILFCEQNENYSIQSEFIFIKCGAIDDLISMFLILLDILDNEIQLFIVRHQDEFGVYEYKGLNNV